MKDHLEGRRMVMQDHVYSIYIDAEPDRVWQAITDGDHTVRYYYGTRVSSDWQPGSPIRYDYPDGRPAADGEVLSIDPPRRLEMTFRALWDPELEAEGHVRQVWELEVADGSTKLTVTTSGMSAKQAEQFTGGMVFIVSSLKTVVERERTPAVAG